MALAVAVTADDLARVRALARRVALFTTDVASAAATATAGGTITGEVPIWSLCQLKFCICRQMRTYSRHTSGIRHSQGSAAPGLALVSKSQEYL